ncbi:hypothetical protein M885DRAFT_569981, partial [Pelagophyceae sp. CCMP2097]
MRSCMLAKATEQAALRRRRKTKVGKQGKVAVAFGRLRPAAAGCVQVDACCELVADVDLEVDARYEL